MSKYKTFYVEVYFTSTFNIEYWIFNIVPLPIYPAKSLPKPLALRPKPSIAS